MLSKDGLTHVIFNCSFEQRNDFWPICSFCVFDFISQPVQPQFCNSAAAVKSMTLAN